MSSKRTFVYFVIVTASIINIFIWVAVFSHSPKLLRVSFLSVGEGNAILIQSPTGTSILINGGPDRSILRALSSAKGPLDRTLTMVIETGISSAGTQGLSGVFDRYRVHALLTRSIPNSTTASRMLASAAAHQKALVQKEIHTGMRVALGAGAYIEVLFSGSSPTKAHTAPPLVLRVVYGNTSFLLSSNTSPKTQNKLATSLASTTLVSDVLAIEHYGAPNSVGASWLTAVHPRFAVISVGKNRYGYPSITTTAKLRAKHIQTLTTRNAPVTFVSDGRILRRE